MKKLLTLAGIVTIIASLTVGASIATAQTTTQTEPSESPDTPVSSQETPTTPSEKPRPATPTERLAEIRASREAFAAARCDKVVENLTARKERITTAADRHLEIYAKVEERVTKIITFAETKSYDTTALSAASATLSADIVAFEEAVATLKDTINAVDTATCESDAATFSGAISASRDELAKTREASQLVRTTIREQVVPASVDFVTSLKGQSELNGTTQGQEEPARTEETQ